MRLSSFISSFTFAVVAAAIAAPAAQAASLSLVDTGSGITINYGQFDRDDSSTGNETPTVTFSGEWLLGSSFANVNRTVYFVDPTAPTNVLSTLTYSQTDLFNAGFLGQMSLTATSYISQGTSLPLPPSTDIGNIFLAGTVFNFNTSNLEANFTTTAIPEPATLSLLAAASGAMLLHRRRR